MDNDNSFGAFVAAILALVCFFIGSCSQYDKSEKRWQTEVVTRGYGEWVVKPDGTTEFKWK